MSAVLGLMAFLSVNSLGFATGTPPVVSPNPVQLTSFEWQEISSPQYAGESLAISITAKDENSNVYPYDGSADLVTTLGSYVFPSKVQFTNGVCNAKVMVSLAQSLALRCSVFTASGTSNVFDVLPGQASRLMAILPGEHLAPGTAGGRSGLPSGQVAGDTFSFDVYVTDAWFNPAARELSDSVYFGSDDSFAELPPGAKLSHGSGSASATLRIAGQHRLYARPSDSSSLRPDTTSPLTVIAGPFAKMLLVAPGEVLVPGDTASGEWETPGKTGSPDPQYLRTRFDVTVYACDRCWNRVTGPGDTVCLLADDSFDFQPTGLELRDPAVFSVQFKAAGQPRIWALDRATGQQSYHTKLDIRAMGATLEVSAPDTVRAGETTDVVIQVLDANGDPMTAALVQTRVTRGSGKMLKEALLTDTAGYATAQFVCTPSPASELDSVRISSGMANRYIRIYVRHLSDSLFAFPNPFGFNRDQAMIFYYLQRSARITLRIYDPFGNEVRTWHFRQNEPGAESGDNVVYWDGRNNQGHRVASGIYVVQVVGLLHTGIDFSSTYRLGVVW